MARNPRFGGEHIRPSLFCNNLQHSNQLRTYNHWSLTASKIESVYIAHDRRRQKRVERRERSDGKLCKMPRPLNITSKAQVWLVSVQLNISLFSFSIRRDFTTIKVEFETYVLSPCYTSIAPNIGEDFCLHLKTPWALLKISVLNSLIKLVSWTVFSVYRAESYFRNCTALNKKDRNVKVSESKHKEHGIDFF